jgi:hypothetical protein
MLAVVASVAVVSLKNTRLGQIRIERVLVALIGLVLFLTLFASLLSLGQDQALPAVIGEIQREDFLYRRLGWYYAAIAEVNQLPEESYVLFLFEPRSYHCIQSRCRPDGILDQWHYAVNINASNDEIVHAWEEQGITHVLYYQLGAEHLREAAMDPITSRDWVRLDQFRDQNLQLIENFGDAYLLYLLAH